MSVASRVRQVAPSPTLALAARTKALVKSGVFIADFTAGEPDFDTPAHIKAVAQAAIQEGFTKYTASSGTPELRQAIVEKLRRDNGLTYQPSQVVVSCGAKHSLYNIFQVLCERGDEVVIPSPYWVSYAEMVRLAEATPVLVQTSADRDFKMTPQELDAAITPRTKALVLNSPSNPVGSVYNRQELRGLSDVLVKRRIWVISDEIYEKITYDGVEAVSIATVESSLLDRALIVNGVSKTYAMTGWRIGYAAGPAEIMSAIDTLQSHATSNPTSISQRAALAAITGDQQCVTEMVAAFRQRRDLMVQRLQQIGLRVIRPSGAFYVFCCIKNVKSTAAEVAQWWLEEAKVAVVPGEGFGNADYVRFSFACGEATIRDGMDRIERLLRSSGSAR